MKDENMLKKKDFDDAAVVAALRRGHRQRLYFEQIAVLRLYLEAGGDSEFNNIVARGTIYATAGLIGGAVIAATYVQSTNYNGTGDGWKLDNANDKILAGQITISNTGATRVFNTEATGSNPVLKIGSSISLLANGTGTLGALVIASSGYIRQGQTDYATGTGFWLGDDSGTTKFSIGSSTKYLRWTGFGAGVERPYA